MFVIRQSQMLGMAESGNRIFEKRLVCVLRTKMPQAAAHFDEPALSAAVHRAIQHAQRHGITTQSNLAEFCALLLGTGALGNCGAGVKWLEQILQNPRLRGDAKILRIRARIQELEATAS
jgi:hypothetical protein